MPKDKKTRKFKRVQINFFFLVGTGTSSLGDLGKNYLFILLSYKIITEIKPYF